MLTLKNVEVVYDDVILVLKGLSLTVPSGQIVALLGSNGAGKSTTLKAISGILTIEDGAVSAGCVRFDGQAITSALTQATQFDLSSSEIFRLNADATTAAEMAARVARGF